MRLLRIITGQRISIILITLILVSALSFTWLQTQAQAVTFNLIVNSELDADLATLQGNATCDLREAIEIANTGIDASNGACGFAPVGAVDLTDTEFVIRFDMTAGVNFNRLEIGLQAPLQMITSRVDIGGYQLGVPSPASIVILEHVATPDVGIGLAFGVNAVDNTISAANSRVTGLEIRNFGIGVQVDNVADVQIGDDSIPVQLAALRNAIYDNVYGVDVRNDALDTVITNNAIGLDGSTVVPNQIDGVFIHMNAENTVVRGNIIGGNGRFGVRGAGIDGITIDTNVIGIPNPTSNVNVGNADAGISLTSATLVNIVDNIVGYSGTVGIILEASPDSELTNNFVGTLPNTITAIPNVLDGIFITGSDNTTLIGNTIFNNQGNGISITQAVGVAVRDTLIANNGGLGLDLDVDGVTFNDSVADADTGANNRQNYTAIQSAGYNAAADTLSVFGTLPTTGADFDMIFYVNPQGECDPTGFGEGRDFLEDNGTPFVLNTTPGTYAFTVVDPTITIGDTITALTINTATGDTSEFARCVDILDDTLVANFTPRNQTILVGETVDFSNLTQGAIGAVRWYINGFLLADTFDFSNQFNQAGLFEIRLEVDSADGQTTETVLGNILVLEPTPIPPPTNTPGVPATPVTPATGVAPTATDVPPTATFVPTATDVPPTATFVPTATDVPPTATFVPTATDVPPTLTLIPTATDVPPTLTLIPTATDVPPTATLIPTITATPALLVTVVGDGDDEMEVVIINGGEGDADNVVMEEILRQGVEFRAADPGIPICTESGGIVSCQLGTLEGGADTVINLTVQTDGQMPDSGMTVVRADGVDPVIIEEPYISKVGNPPVAPPGSEITYTIRVVNPTGETAENMVITDRMPDIIDILDAETTAGDLTIDGQDIRLELSALEPNQRVILTIEARVREDQDAQEIVNTACVISTSNPNPNCAIMSFLAVNTLPPSGEAAWWLLLLRVLAIAGGLGAISYGGWRWLRHRA